MAKISWFRFFGSRVRVPAFGILAAALLLGTSLVAAPGRITSQKRLVLDNKEQRAQFSGNVTLEQEGLLLRCEDLEVRYREEGEKRGVESLRGSGNVSCAKDEKGGRIALRSAAFHSSGLLSEIVFSGNVELSQEGFLLRCDELEARLRSAGGQRGIESLHGSGNVSCDKDNKGERIELRAEAFRSSGDFSKVIFSGNTRPVRVKQGLNSLEGNEVHYNKNTNFIDIPGPSVFEFEPPAH